ncbi:metallophosphoesterase, partial [Arthrospira platensis SPKY1]|nr:metallophosphoesterase [Arthrospira platensis SPKY1]
MRVPVNEQGRDLLVGDVHGCLTKLLDDLSAISFDAEVDRLFLLGDMIDRGDQCMETIAFTQEPFCFPLMGNHELMLYACHHGFMSKHEYAQYGGDWYTGLPDTERQTVGSWVDTLPVCIELQTRKGRIGLVHA